MNIRLLKAYGEFAVGSIVEASEADAQLLIDAGVAEKATPDAPTQEDLINQAVKGLKAKTEEPKAEPIAQKGINIIVPEKKDVSTYQILKATLGTGTERKALGMSEGTPADGGYTVPIEYSRDLIGRAEQRSQLWKLCRQIPMESNSIKFASRDWSADTAVDDTSMTSYGGAVAYWIGEGATITGSKPKFGQVSLALKKLAILQYATPELLEDSMISFASQLDQDAVTLLGKAIDWQVLRGTGVSGPKGILNADALVSVTRTADLAADLASMYSRMDQGSVNSAVWIVSPTVFSAIATSTVGEVPVWLNNTNIMGQPAASIFGRPVIISDICSAYGTVGDILFVDPNQYLFGYKSSGVSYDESIHVAFATDEVAFRWTLRCDGTPAIASAFTLLDGTTTVSPYVALATAQPG